MRPYNTMHHKITTKTQYPYGQQYGGDSLSMGLGNRVCRRCYPFPMLRAMMIRMISEVPAKIVWMRLLTQNFEIGYSSQ